eukprot:scaffold269512_cov31-Tisochrysis_lutea.AAC.7
MARWRRSMREEKTKPSGASTRRPPLPPIETPNPEPLSRAYEGKSRKAGEESEKVSGKRAWLRDTYAGPRAW